MNDEKIYHVVGLMSGSSLDGLDIAYCTFQKKNEVWNYTIEQAETFEYTNDWQQKLIALPQASAIEFIEVNTNIAKLWSGMIKDFIAKNKLINIDFIASHGHTIFHQPLKNYSTQIGNGATMAALTKLPVVCDFRSTDVALNGQGAPLVPIGDILLFNKYDAFLNLGGISNITIKDENKISAFDISPCNQWLNKIAQSVGKQFDENGEMAEAGNCNQQLLDVLNSFYFYHQKAPKSLSNQDCEVFYQHNILPFNLSTDDILRTITEHIAYQINAVLPLINSTKKCLVTGGGAFNICLINQLQKNKNWQFIIPDKKLIAFKEALIFAFLGTLRWRNEINILQTITGATRDTSSGAIYLP
jgi:anhydro-N-acetylmuramic acid kinase